MRVDQGANVIEQLRSVLNLVEDDRWVQALNEGARIAADAVLNVGVLEEDVLRARESGTRRVVFPDRRGPVMTTAGKRRRAERSKGTIWRTIIGI